MTTSMKLGDTVSGEYHGAKFEGIITAFDASGFCYVRLAAPVIVHGCERDDLAIDSYERKSLTFVKAGPELQASDVLEMGSRCMGLVCLAK